MISGQEENDTLANREARSAVEKVMIACIAASFVATPILLRLYQSRIIFNDRFLDIASSYPERIFLSPLPEKAKLVMLVSNATMIIYTVTHLLVMKREIIRNDFKRQDRKILLWILCAFFYFLRFLLIYLFSGDGTISAIVVVLPALTIVSISMALISLSTVGDDVPGSEVS